MAFALVQKANGGTSQFLASGTANTAYASNVTSGNLLLVIGVLYNATGTFSAITDTIGNTWNLPTGFPFHSTTDGATIYLWWAKNKTTGANTAHLTQAGNPGGEFYVAEWSGWPAAGAQDGTLGTHDGSATTSITLPSVTTSNSDDLIICYASATSAPTWGTSGGGGGTWTQGDTLSGDAWAYLADKTAATYNVAFTQSSGTYASIIVALGASGGGGSPTPLNPRPVMQAVNRSLTY